MAGKDAEAMQGLVCGLLDGLMAVCPAGWGEVELKVAHTAAGLRVEEISSKGFGGGAPGKKPQLNVDPRDEVTQLSAGLDALCRALEAKGKAWGGSRIQVTRQPGFCEWRLLGDGDAVAWLTRLERRHLDTLLFTDALFDALLGTERAFEALQQAFERRLGTPTGWEYDQAKGVLTIARQDGAPAALQAEVVGSFDVASSSWLWAWANSHVRADNCRRARSVCQPDAEAPGLAALWLGRFHASEGFAWTLATHVAVCLGARGLWRAPINDGAGVVLLAPLQDPAPAGN